MDKLSLVLVVSAGLALFLVLGGLLIRRFNRDTPPRAEQTAACGDTGSLMMVGMLGAGADSGSCDASSGGGCD